MTIDLPGIEENLTVSELLRRIELYQAGLILAQALLKEKLKKQGLVCQ
jgi:hypothetical protein